MEGELNTMSDSIVTIRSDAELALDWTHHAIEDRLATRFPGVDTASQGLGERLPPWSRATNSKETAKREELLRRVLDGPLAARYAEAVVESSGTGVEVVQAAQVDLGHLDAARAERLRELDDLYVAAMADVRTYDDTSGSCACHEVGTPEVSLEALDEAEAVVESSCTGVEVVQAAQVEFGHLDQGFCAAASAERLRELDDLYGAAMAGVRSDDDTLGSCACHEERTPEVSLEALDEMVKLNTDLRSGLEAWVRQYGRASHLLLVDFRAMPGWAWHEVYKKFPPRSEGGASDAGVDPSDAVDAVSLESNVTACDVQAPDLAVDGRAAVELSVTADDARNLDVMVPEPIRPVDTHSAEDVAVRQLAAALDVLSLEQRVMLLTEQVRGALDSAGCTAADSLIYDFVASTSRLEIISALVLGRTAGAVLEFDLLQRGHAERALVGDVRGALSDGPLGQSRLASSGFARRLNDIRYDGRRVNDGSWSKWLRSIPGIRIEDAILSPTSLVWYSPPIVAFRQ